LYEENALTFKKLINILEEKLNPLEKVGPLLPLEKFLVITQADVDPLAAA